MEKKCTNCKHCVPCKKFIYGVDDPWEWYYICDKFAYEKNGWALDIGDGTEDMCEEWIPKQFMKVNYPNRRDDEIVNILGGTWETDTDIKTYILDNFDLLKNEPPFTEGE